MIETYYRILKHDPEGRLVKDTGLLPSHSYVIQFLEFFEGVWSVTDKNATDVTGAESVLVDVSDNFSGFMYVNAGAGVDTHGVVVGTNAGTTAEDNENFALDTKIADGAGGGQLGYQAVTFVATRVVGPNVDLDISRVFVNTSGGTITVKEIGIIGLNAMDTKYHLHLRDVVSDEPVDNAESLTVVYVLRTTV